jgi:cytidylate kinase
VVFPQAAVKVFLTADQADRAQRRAAELGLSHEETVKAQKIRDEQDSSRRSAPLMAAQDALVLDSTHLDLQEVIAQILIYIQKKVPDLSL